jgi:hypothetical protein
LATPLVPPPPIEGITFNQHIWRRSPDSTARHSEPLALVIAESRHLAEDALADIVAISSPFRCRRSERRRGEPPTVHDDARTSPPGSPAQSGLRGGQTHADRDPPPLSPRHGASMPMETRGRR